MDTSPRERTMHCLRQDGPKIMPYKDQIERLAQKRRWYRANKDKHAAWEIKDRATNPEKYKASKLRQRYGLSLDLYDKLFKQQGGLCALCRERPPTDVDHDHDSGAVRALLCHACNIGLGFFGDSIEQLQAAITYLQTAETAASTKKKLPDQRGRGEAHSMAKLTEADVLSIRSEHAAGGITSAGIARKRGLCRHHVAAIVKRTTWRHLP